MYKVQVIFPSSFFFFFASEHSFAPAQIVEKTIFPPLNRLCAFLENQLTIHMSGSISRFSITRPPINYCTFINLEVTW